MIATMLSMSSAAPETATGTAGDAEAQAVQSLNTAVGNLWNNVSGLHPGVTGVALVLVGIGFLLLGYPLYKWLVILAFAAVGFFVGLAAAAAFNVDPMIGMIAGPLVLGLLAWPLHRIGWALLGGAAFAFVFGGYAGAAKLVTNQTYLYIIEGVSFVVGFIMTFCLFRPLIIIVTSVMGATMVFQGGLYILTVVHPATYKQLANALEERPWICPAVILPLAILGAILQARHGTPVGEAKTTKKGKKPEKAEK